MKDSLFLQRIKEARRRKKIRERKIIRLLILFIILCISFLSIYFALRENEVIETVYIVKPNDTLWDIANKYTAKHQDIREVIYNIRQDNDLNSNFLSPGQKIIIKKTVNKVFLFLEGE